jgi:hypothetical protein
VFAFDDKADSGTADPESRNGTEDLRFIYDSTAKIKISSHASSSVQKRDRTVCFRRLENLVPVLLRRNKIYYERHPPFGGGGDRAAGQ